MKTADEMFRELGYELKYNDSELAEYREVCCEYERPVRIIFYKEARHVNAYLGKSIVYLEFPEVLACAQLIKEMEETNEN